MQLTDKQKIKKIKKRLIGINKVLENPSLAEEVERELFFQQDFLEALYIRLKLDIFMATLGYEHLRSSEF
jgi:uncharacterized protein (UPF0276 family)